jgi:hypothetical protein
MTWQDYLVLAAKIGLLISTLVCVILVGTHSTAPSISYNRTTGDSKTKFDTINLQFFSLTGAKNGKVHIWESKKKDGQVYDASTLLQSDARVASDFVTKYQLPLGKESCATKLETKPSETTFDCRIPGTEYVKSKRDFNTQAALFGSNMLLLVVLAALVVSEQIDADASFWVGVVSIINLCVSVLTVAVAIAMLWQLRSTNQSDGVISSVETYLSGLQYNYTTHNRNHVSVTAVILTNAIFSVLYAVIVLINISKKNKETASTRKTGTGG